jgi:hypothetical protein
MGEEVLAAVRAAPPRPRPGAATALSWPWDLDLAEECTGTRCAQEFRSRTQTGIPTRSGYQPLVGQMFILATPRFELGRVRLASNSAEMKVVTRDGYAA